MKTAQEIEDFLNKKLPDGPDNNYEEGAQDMANWILGWGIEPDIGEN